MVCLVGMILGKMEKDERKIREKIVGKCVWLEGGGKEKTSGDQLFSLWVHQITISPK